MMSNEKLEQIIKKGIIDRVEYGLIKGTDYVVKTIKGRCGLTYDEAKEKFKWGIFSFVDGDLKSQGQQFLGYAKSTNDVYKFPNLSIATEFFKEEWRDLPLMMMQDEFDNIQGYLKKPFKYTRYDYKRAIYNIVNNSELHSNYTIKVLKDKNIVKTTQFYLSEEDENQTIYAKQTEFCFAPKSFKKIEKDNVDTRTDIEKLRDEELFKRTLSISMYVLLDGDPNRAMSFMRYDNQYDNNGPHRNTYVGKDKRFEVFGDKAGYPHFHFQSENDTLFCLMKKQRKNEYKVSRCNAIDCKHLKSYLLKLDSKSDHSLKEERHNNGSYNMPFLAMKEEKYKIKLNLDKLIESYIAENKVPENKNVIIMINDWLENAQKKDEYKDNENKCFADLIKAIDFVKQLNLLRCNKTLTFDEMTILSDIEAVVATEIVDGVNKISSMYVTKVVDGNEEEFYIN